MQATALQAAAVAILIPQGHAQLAPTAHPTGGQVVAGAASIGQTSAQTTINQSSQRAAIEWQNFDVGSQHTVQFNQPSSSAVTLNRVVGPDPSQIAGKISANGDLIITNAAGVMFHQGAQVNANSLVVSAPGITNQNFMAGHMVFDQAPRPNAAVRNAGTITVKQEGLAALVAPQVANSGTINARLGHAVLAGANGYSVDLYGDGLVSLDVTKSVTQIPVGRDGKPVTALVTNTGTVIADGGTVQLTAKAVDGIVQNLVRAGGRIQANTVGSRAGRVVIQGVGGSVRIDGQVLAQGGPGESGGTISARASQTVTIARGARVDASGYGGGGTVALGTTITRAAEGRLAALRPGAESPRTPRGTARSVVVENGASVAADGLGHGSGGTVSVLSTNSTTIDGALSARGGALGGNGGVIEASSDGVLALNQAPDLGAPSGTGGTLFLDPYDLVIGTGTPAATYYGGDAYPTVADSNPPTTGTSYISPAMLQASSKGGAVTISLSASDDLTVSSNIDLSQGNPSSINGGASLYLHAGQDLSVRANITLGSLDPQGHVPQLTLDAGGNILIGGVIRTASTGTVTLAAGGTISAGVSAPMGTIVTGTLTGNASMVDLEGANQISHLAAFTTTGTATNPFYLVNTTPITITGNVSASAGNVVIDTSATPTADVTVAAPITTSGGNFVVRSGHSITVAPGGSIDASNPTGEIFLEASFGANNPAATGAVAVNGPLTANQIFLDAGPGGIAITSDITALSSGSNPGFIALRGLGNVNAALIDTIRGPIQQTAGTITTPQLSARGTSVSLNDANVISSIGIPGGGGMSVATTGDFSITSTVPLAVNQTVQTSTAGQTISISDPSPTIVALSASTPTLDALGGTVVLGPEADGQTLTLGSAVQPNSIAASTLQIGTAGASAVAITAPVDVTGVGTVALVSAGTIAESGGGQIVGSNVVLRGVAGSAALGGANQVATLSGFNTTNGFMLNDTQALTVTAPVLAASGPISLSVPGGQTLTVLAPLTAPGAQISLQTDAFATNGSSISTGASGEVAIAPATPGHDVVLAGSLGGINTGTLALGSLDDGRSVAAGSITIDAPLTLPGDTIAFYTTGSLTQSAAGTITAAALTGSAASASLTSSNTIGTLAGFTTTGGFALTNAQSLDVIGAVSDPVSVAIKVTTGTLTLNNSIATALLDLEATGSIVQNAGSIATATLTANAGGAIQFGSGNNQVATLGGVTSAAGFNLRDVSGLTVSGPVTDSQSVNLTVGGPLALQGNVSAPAVTLTASGAITQNAGVLTASTLTGSGASASLTAPGNQIGNLGAFATTGNFALVDNTPLTLTGAVQVGAGGRLGIATDSLQVVQGGSLAAPSGEVALAPATPGSTVNLPGLPLASLIASRLVVGSLNDGASALAGDITVNAPISLPGGTLALYGTGNVTGAGAISAGTLTGSANLVNLTGANQVDTLGPFAVVGTNLGTFAPVAFYFRNTRALQIAGNLSAQTGNVIVDSSLSGADITVTTPLASPGGDLALRSGHNVTITSTGSVTVTAPNSGAYLEASFGANSPTADGAVVINGPVSGPNVYLGAGSGGIDLAANVKASTYLALRGLGNTTQSLIDAYRGPIQQTAGTITAASLSARGTSVSLDGTNAIGQLGLSANGSVGSSTASVGDFSLASTLQQLLIVQPVTVALGHSITLINDQPVFAGGALNAPGGTVTLAPAAGQILALASAIPAGAISANTLQLGSPTAGPVVITAPVDASGVVDLDLASTGAVSESGAGAIDTGTATLTGAAASIALGGNNQIVFLGDISGGSSLSLADQQPLSLTGSLAAATLQLTAPGSVTLLDGHINTNDGTITVTPPASGSAFLVQIGATSVAPYSSGSATLRLALPASGGVLRLQGLTAPSLAVVLEIGSGTASGTISAGALQVVGSGGGATLSGLVNGQGGAGAAPLASIVPGVDSAYLLNGCVIASATCTLVIPAPPQHGQSTPSATAFAFDLDPLLTPKSFLENELGNILKTDLFTADLIVIGIIRDPTDPELLLPNISDRDY